MRDQVRRRPDQTTRFPELSIVPFAEFASRRGEQIVHAIPKAANLNDDRSNRRKLDPIPSPVDHTAR
jgi:hypothetical protein